MSKSKKFLISSETQEIKELKHHGVADVSLAVEGLLSSFGVVRY
jgi:hypothetical protein